MGHPRVLVPQNMVVLQTVLCMPVLDRLLLQPCFVDFCVTSAVIGLLTPSTTVSLVC